MGRELPSLSHYLGGEILGEDYDFCDRARAAGFTVWCDTQLSFDIGHIGQSVHRLAGP